MTVSYDVFDRATTITKGAVTTQAKYDAFGRRIEQRLGSGAKRIYFYGLRGELLAEYDSPANGITPSRSYQYLAGRRLGQWTDRTGSVRYLPAGGVYQHYYPFGEEVTSTAGDTYKFAELYRDAETGLDYAMNRYRTPVLGRFLTSDPYLGAMRRAEPQSFNRYSYVHNDPVNSTDPSGLWRRVPPGCIVTPDGHGIVCPESPYDDGENPDGGGEPSAQDPTGDGNNRHNKTAVELFADLNAECQEGLRTALSVRPGTSDEVAAELRLDALGRAGGVTGILARAAGEHGISSAMLAAIGIRETGFRNIDQPDGLGRGVFQIDLGAHPNVTVAQAHDLAWAANFAANLLATNMATLAAAHPNFNATQLLQATAASYNFGTGNISGNPNTIDVGTTGNNYGSNILNLMRCFQE